MSKNSWLRDFIVGLVFLGALLAVGYTTLWLEGMPWNRAYALEVRFPEVDNLRKGEPVLLSGVPVGQVQSVAYSPDPSGADRNVIVVVTLQQDLSGVLTREAKFFVRSAGPLGGRQLEIEPGAGARLEGVAEPAFTGEADGDLFRQLADFIRENRGPISDLLTNLDAAAADLREVMREVRSGQGLVARLINDEKLSNDVGSAVDRVNSIVGSIENSDGALGALIKDRELRDKVTAIFDDIESQKGIVGLLVHDESAKNDLREFISSASTVAKDVREGEGLVARLINDPKLANDVQEAFGKFSGVGSDLSDVMAQIRSGEGTLGKLVYDELAWKEITRLLVLARESIEDLREQAPINTFTNVIFSAF